MDSREAIKAHAARLNSMTKYGEKLSLTPFFVGCVTMWPIEAYGGLRACIDC